MPLSNFTQYEADALVAAAKVAGKVMSNTMKGDNRAATKEITIAVRRKDSPSIDLVLVLNGRIKVKKLPGVASIHKPGVALMWHGKRIRGVDWKIRHEVTQNGIVTGFIKGWHEHIWTDSEDDKFIIPVSPKMQNEDFRAVLEWSVKKWNIEGIKEQPDLEGLW